jgi:hypothetical protein
MIAGGGPDGTIARNRRPLLLPPLDADVVAAAGADAETETDAGAAFDVPAKRSKPSAVRTEKPARRTKP